ncbi:Alpha/beta hydrolase family protein [Yoonia tamlensis]|uniref:Alpha/beta hydrolase family protein n=1 Tax=Yoonia tamlensis TaxID=390270 RepID=A0A1I6GSS2_9RHOB|nr:alpha/beta hydrolase [Yoonia tamlensis]SFR45228.1 Alpha/beta hydrolase family protein [Yoonia tamlensis]
MEFDDAFANAAYIADGARYPDKWAAQAAQFRASARHEPDIPYGAGARLRFDLFHPVRPARGVVVFVHGGYWRMFDKSYWSHLAAGPLALGWAVAIPSYDLCPQATITQIGDQIASAVSVVAQRVSGPIRLTGHSAGAQLVARIGAIGPNAAWKSRLTGVFPISPVADLTPLCRTTMNADLGLDAQEAHAQSPLNMPAPACKVEIWVGADERPVFIEQSQYLAKYWGCGLILEHGKHHFNIIEGLSDPIGALTRAVCYEEIHVAPIG